MRSPTRRCGLIVLLAGALAACSTSTDDPAIDPGGAGVLFEQPVAEAKTLREFSDEPEANPDLAALLASPSTQDVWPIDINTPEFINASSPVLSITLPKGDRVRFDLKRTSDVAGMSGWIGDVASDRKRHYPSPDEVDFDPFNWISLVRDGGQVVGDIHFKGQLYRLYPIAAGRHVLVKVDESRMPPNGQPVLLPRSSSGPAPDKIARPARSIIRVLFVTTSERRARSKYYRLELVQALQNANQYLINSHVPLTYELAGFLDPDYSEGAKSQWAMLHEMARTSSTLGSQVAAQREASKADLVSLYNVESSICGNAYGWSKKETGFHTISCTVALAHELGHNLGGGHVLEGIDPSRHYNHGYRHRSPDFHTIQVTSHGAIPYFSNPRLQYQGVPIGTVQNHDVARQFGDYMGVVEDFYKDGNEFTVYEHANYQGDSCTFTSKGGVSAYLADMCGEGWQKKVSSLKVSKVKPGARVRILSDSGSGARYISLRLDGDLELPTLQGPVEIPGAELNWLGGSLDDKVYQVWSNER